jgi:hypothetical protein
MMSTELDFAPANVETLQIEMRAAARHPILQRCFVHPPSAPPGRAWQCIAYDISAKGVGLALPVKLAKGTLLTIHAFELPKARPLQVRVVQAKSVDVVWFTGCELLSKLAPAELQVWRSGPRDWLDKAKE